VIVDESKADIKVHDDIANIDFDPTQLRQVISNLLCNAIKYSAPERKPKIEIGGRLEENDAIIWVQDNGMGISEENQKKIFQPFFRVKRDKEGTGVGLSIVKKIIEKNGGKLWVESNPGNGSTFFFTIPKEVNLCRK
jgi:two-component system phosphate regulon sensor histidine kinase PhoR